MPRRLDGKVWSRVFTKALRGLLGRWRLYEPRSASRRRPSAAVAACGSWSGRPYSWRACRPSVLLRPRASRPRRVLAWSRFIPIPASTPRGHHDGTRRRFVVHQRRGTVRSGGSPPLGRSPTTPAPSIGDSGGDHGRTGRCPVVRQ